MDMDPNQIILKLSRDKNELISFVKDNLRAQKKLWVEREQATKWMVDNLRDAGLGETADTISLALPFIRDTLNMIITIDEEFSELALEMDT